MKLDRNLPPDLNDLIGWQAEEVTDMNGVALHHGKQPLLPGRQTLAIFTADDGLVADIISDIVEVDRASQRFAGHQ